MAKEDQPGETLSSEGSDDVRRVVADCLRRRAAGEDLPDQAVIDAHPELMPALAEELARLRVIESALDAANRSGSGDAGAAAAGVAGLHVRCPHCHNPVEIVMDAPLTDLTCSACGSHFSLVEDENTYATPMVRSIGHFDTIERLGTGAFASRPKIRRASHRP